MDNRLYSDIPEGQVKNTFQQLEGVSIQQEIEQLRKENESLKERIQQLQMELQAIGYERMSE